MILLLVVDRPRSINDTVDGAFDSLVVRDFPLSDDEG